MNDFETDLKEALAMANPTLDETRFRARVLARVARRRHNLVAATAVSLALGAATVVFATTPTPPVAPNAPINTSARRGAPAPRPMFALALPARRERPAKAIADEIAQLRAALARTVITDPARADLLFRLGEAYREKPDVSAALIHWRAIYDDKRYRSYARRDEALFQAAWLLYEQHRADEADPLFQRILDEHPRSKFVPNAALARAEASFEAGNMQKALAYYGEIEKYPASPVFGYALYKIGWAHYNLGDIEHTRATWKRVIALGSEGKLYPGNSEQLVKECRKDLARLEENR